MKKMYIVLEDGHIFEGKGFGASGETVGELVFTTGMVGYIETLTDPSYYGQIVMHTFPLIGNYGMITEDMESDASCIKGYVVRDCCDTPSNFRCEGQLEDFLKKSGIISVCDVDTREITRIIREQGVMNACITDDPSKVDLEALKAYKIVDAVKSVSTHETKEYKAENEKYKVALLDYGAKMNIVRELLQRGCSVYVLPYDTKAEDVLALDIDGIMLSNGPGDPAENVGPIAEIKKMLGKKPIFGICLGHQLTAIAAGGKTEKLKYGHRGANQPVKRLEDGRVFVTSQNHGYAVIGSSIDEKIGKVSFINANDGTCEGVEYPEYNAYTVQFHPEACAGPIDTEFLFDRFVTMMGGDK